MEQTISEILSGKSDLRGDNRPQQIEPTLSAHLQMSAPPAAEGSIGEAKERKHACVSCYSRKVKCDRKWPCTTCSKGKTECIYKDPAPPRRKKRMTEADLLDRINKYEDHLRRAGIAIDPQQFEHGDSPDTDPTLGASSNRLPEFPYPASNSHPDATVTISGRPNITSSTPVNVKPTADGGRLVTDAQGHTRYVDSGLWMTIHKEVPDSDQIVQEGADSGSEEDAAGSGVMDPAYLLFLGGSSVKAELVSYFPTSSQAMHLWQTYVKYVMPIGRFVHQPTVTRVVEQARHDPRTVSNNKLALLYCIFLMSVTAMDEQDCMQYFGQDRNSTRKHYQFLAQHALMKSHFLRSADPDVLTAYVHYLLAMRLDFDSHSLWALTGVAFRIARRIGLHKDGLALGLSPFETEMRRRLWFQLIVLDYTSAELAGLIPEAYPPDTSQTETKRPMNLNDSDLDPDMKQIPPERVGATEMIFTMMRNEFKAFFQHATMMNEKAKQKQAERSDDATDAGKAEDFWEMLKEKDAFINALEKNLEDRILRFCDPLEPLHYLTSIAVRTAVAGMRLRAHHPRQYADGGQSMPQAEKDLLFTTSSKIISYFNLVHHTPLLKGFLWHIKVYFQWHSLIYVLTELRHRTTGSEVDKAWENLLAIFENLQSVLLSPRYVLHAAIISLTLSAWECREAELQKQKLPYRVPELIPRLRAIQANKRSHRGHDPKNSMGNVSTESPTAMAGYAGHRSHNEPPPMQRAYPVTQPAPFWGHSMDSVFGSAPPGGGGGSVAQDPLADIKQGGHPMMAGMLPYSQPQSVDANNAIGSTPSSAFNLPTPENWAQWDDLLKGTDMSTVDFNTDAFVWGGAQVFS